MPLFFSAAKRQTRSLLHRALSPSVLPSLTSPPSSLRRRCQGTPLRSCLFRWSCVFFVDVAFSGVGGGHCPRPCDCDPRWATTGLGQPRDGRGDVSVGDEAAGRLWAGRSGGAAAMTLPPRTSLLGGRRRGGPGHSFPRCLQRWGGGGACRISGTTAGISLRTRPPVGMEEQGVVTANEATGLLRSTSPLWTYLRSDETTGGGMEERGRSP